MTNVRQNIMSASMPPDEIALMKRIKAQDENALSELYDLYGSYVYGMAMRVLQNVSLAEEATQDTFMKVWREANSWDPNRGKLVSWLMTIARYTAIDHLRREKRLQPDQSVAMEDMLNLLGTPGMRDRNDLHDSALLKNLMQELPPQQIEAIELAFFQGMTHQDIADHLSEPLGTIKSRIRYGLQTLRGKWLQATSE
ncbi:sigma-70 family RNA polymerase sigma factor [Phototrophicus methaneseepsis]|uniref:Sigma-70 family RNA polymerase sigma factor n=1 Tax=Phototrophicus methaneseepsis TaxID=2710758 RepID=A0A7S8IE94_9CHLR|nr:sigma-70 family RNA polymerase sigma factor [Phototrophicus methaneseepsis]QPC82332.1 sigma-70 family RNA polymerase sigma factor [Phototrophicus methaneseepsis]